MPRKSTRKNKTIYQLSREKAGLTREAAGERMPFISDDKIENIESGRSLPQPEDVLEMARVYQDPLLANTYCATQCPIGQKYVPQLTEKELSQITLDILASLNELNTDRERLVDITVDGGITADENADFSRICGALRKMSIASNTLQLWLEKRLQDAD
ncbi:MAG: helix-turn-helix domain-containing protein [Lachnospiraceae bacterium]|nr:helix-turn-helix domain-containing protein [Lachnospiraceae bacterium]